MAYIETNGVKIRRKKSYRWIATIFVSMMSLIVALLVGVSSVFLSNANQQLNNQLYNFKPTMAISSKVIDMGLPNGWSSSGSIIFETNHDGFLEATIQIVTPQYGKVEIRFKNFTVSDNEYLSPERRNETSVYPSWTEDNYEYLVAQGISTIESKILLTAKVFIDPQRMPPKEDTKTFLLGQAFFEADLTNLQTQEISVVREFSERVLVSLPPQ